MKQKIAILVALLTCTALLLSGCEWIARANRDDEIVNTKGQTIPAVADSTLPTADTESAKSSESTQAPTEATQPQTESPIQVSTEETASQNSGNISSGTIVLPFVPAE